MKQIRHHQQRRLKQSMATSLMAHHLDHLSHRTSRSGVVPGNRSDHLHARRTRSWCNASGSRVSLERRVDISSCRQRYDVFVLLESFIFPNKKNGRNTPKAGLELVHRPEPHRSVGKHGTVRWGGPETDGTRICVHVDSGQSGHLVNLFVRTTNRVTRCSAPFGEFPWALPQASQ